jgi:hypothetical protein
LEIRCGELARIEVFFSTERLLFGDPSTDDCSVVHGRIALRWIHAEGDRLFEIHRYVSELVHELFGVSCHVGG